MIAVKCETPNIPRLEMVKVPPCDSKIEQKVKEQPNVSRTWYSEGANFPSRAFLANALVSAEMVARPFEPASFTMGVMRPVGVATATEISAFLYLLEMVRDSSLQEIHIDSRPDHLSEPRRVSFGNIGQGASNSFDDKIVYAELSTFVLL